MDSSDDSRYSEMIRRVPGKMLQKKTSPFINDEGTGHLHRITLGPTEKMSLGDRLQPLQQQSRRSDLPEGCLFQAISAIQMFFRIADQGKHHVKLLPELFRLCRLAHADQHDTDIRRIKRCLVVAQLRNLLSAERSAEMP